MSAIQFNRADEKTWCGFCYPREQGTHGEIRREWIGAYGCYGNVCREHSPREMDNLGEADLEDQP